MRELSRATWRTVVSLGVVVMAWVVVPSLVQAQEGAAAPAIDNTKVALDTIWTMVAAFLVFFMNLGFAMVESGLCRAKNTVNILFKNFIVFAASSLAFLVLGFGLMFGDGNPYFGTQGLWFVGGADNSPLTGDAYQGVYTSIAWTSTPLWTKFFFQLVFAGTAATIVSGAVAERIKFGSFFAFSFIIVAFIYPVVGHWIWGGGWLASARHVRLRRLDGRALDGGMGGARRRADCSGRVWASTATVQMYPIPGHSMTSATLGVFVLWFGWFGFNPGLTMAAD